MRADESGFIFENMTMEGFVERISGMRLDRPVINRTGLLNRYDFRLEFDGGAFAIKMSMSNGSFAGDLAAAVQSQLGLKMESTKAPVEMLIVDRAEKAPSEN